MKFEKNSKKNALIALTLLFIIVIPLTEFPMTNAQLTTNYPTWIYVATAPNPIGVGQPILFIEWTAELPPQTPTDHLLGSVGNRAAWTGITATLTDPDGQKQTLQLAVTDPVGSTFYRFVPDKVGNYSIQVHFPAQWKNTTTYNRLYAAADSPIATFTVQEEPLSWLPSTPLPTEYWTRPIHAYNREWSQIGGNWLGDGQGNQYTTAPNTSHIMWTEPLQLGGIVGGNFADISYYEGTSYEQRFSYPIIISGILIYTQPLNHKDFHSRDLVATAGQSLIARDLRTGEELWRRDGVGVTDATIYSYKSPNQGGAHAYLWYTIGGNSIAYDPFTGGTLFNITGVPSGRSAVGPNGERQIYVIGGPTTNRAWLSLWDFSYILSMTTLPSSQWEEYWADPEAFVENTNYWQWRPVTALNSATLKSHNGSHGYKWNVTLPAGLNGNIIYALEDRIIGGSGFVANGNSAYHETFSAWAVSTKEGSVGNLLWHIKPKGTIANETLQFEGGMASNAGLEAGVFVMRAKESRKYIGFDINTGAQLWVTEAAPEWMMYSRGCEMYDGKLYTAGYGGEVFAYDLTNGNLLWKSAIDSEGLESAYIRAPLSTPQIVDGKVYVYAQEHSFTQPYYRTWKMYAFDANTGDRLWDITGGWKTAAFADGYMATANLYDMQVYVFGKGPTAITLDVPSTSTELGKSLVIRGSVTDISAGARTSDMEMRFPHGVPAIADEHMNRWMEHVYMQMPLPNNITGVTVNLDVIDANGNNRPIGTAISDSSGMFSLPWKPDINGAYTIIASFKGSESYYPSSAQSAFVVDDVIPSETTPPQTVTQPPTEMYFVGSTVAIILAIAIVGLLLLRKRQ